MRRGQRPCAFCGNPVEGNFRRVVGWERSRRGGGLHHLYVKRGTGEFACDACGFDLVHDVEPGTPKLFDVPPVQPIAPARRDHA